MRANTHRPARPRGSTQPSSQRDRVLPPAFQSDTQPSRPHRSWLRIASASAGLLFACSRPPAPSRFPATPPLETDRDRHLFEPIPRESFSSAISDGVDKTLFHPLSRLLAFDPSGEATNVNSLDEVPSSSWFTNRLGRRAMSPEMVAAGPCRLPPLDGRGGLEVTRSKPDGSSPGFVVRDASGQHYLLKFDGPSQGPRGSAADAIVSRLYHAAGYNVPCNRVLFFDRSEIALAPEARQTDWLGNKSPMRGEDLDEQLQRAPQLPDGRYRALASQWLDGRSIGPWSFEGRRQDDPNDIVPHEDRRELRGLRLLAAWVGHKDQREQNTLDSFMPVERSQGWVRHSIIDFGDCLGHFSPPALLARRLSGHAHGFDLAQVATDLATLGAIERRFERERFGPSGPVFAYYNVRGFWPESWKGLYPNPAFERMTTRDAAWMARILASFERAHLERVVRAGRMGDARLDRELVRILWGRRERLLRAYLARLSPLSQPEVEGNGNTAQRLCVRDLLVRSGLSKAPALYRVSVRGQRDALAVRVEGERVCANWTGPPNSSSDYVVVEFTVAHAGWPDTGRLEVHLYYEPGSVTVPRVAGLRRISARPQTR